MTEEEAEEIKKEWLKEYPSIEELQARMAETLEDLTKVGHEQRRLAHMLAGELRVASGKNYMVHLPGLEKLPIETLRSLLSFVRDSESEVHQLQRQAKTARMLGL